MGNPKRSFSYQMHITGDGSPTLSLPGGEKMHSLDGALAESLYIYKPCLESALNQEVPCFLSMGLGLGYNEMIAGGLLVSNNRHQFRLASFESQPDLKANFLSWLQGHSCELSEIYQTISQMVGDHFSLTGEAIRNFLSDSLQSGRFHVEDSLPHKNPWSWRFHSVLYDAFSGESDPHLWSEQHLDEFLSEFSHPSACFFSTYAATGNLKRSLVKAEFVVEKKKGFGKKRESTFAKRILPSQKEK